MRENVVSSMGQKIGQMKEVDDPLLDHLHTYIYMYIFKCVEMIWEQL